MNMVDVNDLTPEQIVKMERRQLAMAYFSMYLIDPNRNPELCMEIKMDLGILYSLRGLDEIPRTITVEDFLEIAESTANPMYELMSWDNDQVLIDRYLDRLNVLKDPNQDGTFGHKMIEASWIRFKEAKNHTKGIA